MDVAQLVIQKSPGGYVFVSHTNHGPAVRILLSGTDSCFYEGTEGLAFAPATLTSFDGPDSWAPSYEACMLWECAVVLDYDNVQGTKLTLDRKYTSISLHIWIRGVVGEVADSIVTFEFRNN